MLQIGTMQYQGLFFCVVVTVGNIFDNSSYIFEVLPIFLHHFALDIQYMCWYHNLHLLFWKTFVPAAPVFHLVIETARIFNLVLLRNTHFWHLLHNKQLTASFAFCLSPLRYLWSNFVSESLVKSGFNSFQNR